MSLLRPSSVILMLAASSCGKAGARPSASADGHVADAFRQEFRVVDTLQLEEGAETPIIYPSLYFDRSGGLFVLEASDRQVRLHGNDGRLVSVAPVHDKTGAGRRQPTGVDRMLDGRLVVATLAGELLFASDDNLVASVQTPLSPVFAVTGLDSSTVLVSGRNAPYPTALLHVWDINQKRVVKSFLPPPRHLDSTLVNTLSHAEFAVRGTKVAAIHQLVDSLYLFDRADGSLRQFKIAIADFQAPTGPLPRITSMGKRREWIETIPFLIDLHWLDDASVIVQSRLGGGRRATYTLTKVDTAGRTDWHAVGTPRLLGIRDGRFYFHVLGDDDARNRIVVAVRNDGR